MIDTVEWQEWLKGEINRIQYDVSLLESAISKYDSYRDLYLSNKAVIENSRYSHLTSEEIEVKVSEDRKKLEASKKQFELMSSASKLDIAVVVKGRSCWTVNIIKEIPDPYLEFKFNVQPNEYRTSRRAIIYLGSRRLEIICDESDYGRDEYIFEKVTNIFWGNHDIVVEFISGAKVYLGKYTGYIKTEL